MGLIRKLFKRRGTAPASPIEAVRRMSDRDLADGLREHLAKGEFGGVKLVGPVHLTDDQARILAKQSRVWAVHGIEAGTAGLTIPEAVQLDEVMRIINGAAAQEVNP